MVQVLVFPGGDLQMREMNPGLDPVDFHGLQGGQDHEVRVQGLSFLS